MRADICEETAGEYALAIQRGDQFPPVVVFKDKVNYWLADGFTRYRAHEIARQRHIIADVRLGTVRDAILYAVGANAAHGLRRSNEDKRRSVLTLLKDHEWSQWSNRQIAEQCGVDEGLVRKLKRERTAPPPNTGPAGSADYPQTSRVFNLDDLPTTAKAAYQSLEPTERLALLEAVQADVEQEANDELEGIRVRIENCIAGLRAYNQHLGRLAAEADLALDRYETVARGADLFQRR